MDLWNNWELPKLQHCCSEKKTHIETRSELKLLLYEHAALDDVSHELKVLSYADKCSLLLLLDISFFTIITRNT